MFEKWKAARERSRRAHAIAQEQAQQQRYREQLQNWQNDRDDLVHRIDVVQQFRGEAAVEGFMLKKDERAFGIIEGAALIEPRRSPGHFEAGSSGVSFRIAKGVNYRVGATRGHYVPGPEEPAAIDVGRLLISGRRIAFAGEKASREWLFDKVIAVENESGWTAVQVSNRQKTSGFGYGSAVAAEVQFRLELALAVHNDTVVALEQKYTAALADQDRLRPLPPPPALDPAPPPE